MQINSVLNNSTSFSIDQKSEDFNKKLRIYYDRQNYVDIALHQFDTSDVFFVKDKQNYSKMKDILKEECYAFIENFSDSQYLNFLQEQYFIAFDLDNSFPNEV